MDGVLNIHKKSGPTSHDVVAQVRRATGEQRAGHAGALDPIASGVLLICLGNATRIVEYLMDWRKAYRAGAVFGVETDTEDGSGTVLRETDCSQLTRDRVEAVLPGFTGRISQVPPMVSALRHKGRRLYELARSGETVERAPRPVEIYSLRLMDFVSGVRATAILEIECSRGTYVRTLCADIGRALGCGGCMSSLVRTAVGRFRLEDAISVETVEEKAACGQLGDVLHAIDDVLDDMPCVSVADEDVKRVLNGAVLPVERVAGAEGGLSVPLRIHGPDGRLLGVGKLISMAGGEVMLKPDKVFVGSD